MEIYRSFQLLIIRVIAKAKPILTEESGKFRGDFKKIAGSSVRNRVVPAPDLESHGYDEQEDYEHQERLKPFDDCDQIHAYT